MSRYGKHKRAYRRRLWAGFVDGKLALVNGQAVIAREKADIAHQFDDVRLVELREIKRPPAKPDEDRRR